MNMSDDSKLPIPSPAGTNANGEPYWIINDQQITWTQMQQLIWEQMQKTQAAVASGKGPEQIVTMPKIDELLDAVTKPDIAAEKSPESGPKLNHEKIDNKIEVVEKPKSVVTVPAAQTTAPKIQSNPAAKVVGDTHKASKIRLNFADVKEMYNFYVSNKQRAKKPDPQSADDYLVVFVGRLLRMMASQNKQN